MVLASCTNWRLLPYCSGRLWSIVPPPPPATWSSLASSARSPARGIATGGVLAPRYTRTRPGLVLSASTPSLFCFSYRSSFNSSINLTPVAVSPIAQTSTSLHCRLRHRDPHNCPLLRQPDYFIEVDAAVLDCCNF
ncbi:hypothetical protein BHM03_00010114 [Ensete ventricosum]|uniref:Uncharacterized protein n=1 Tax=Ensete ventricosum TaxID=4639 RepID=A0A445MCQ2_ENSVE|nr:hypothetical protein BHM03_00010114 [Ensete ventricosum]